MFKNMLKRSWLSIKRKPGKAIIVGLVLFAMANLVLASIAIKGAVNESMAYAKSSLGGTVYLQPDIEKIRKAATANGTESFTPGQQPSFTRPEIKVSTVKKLADSSYVKDYTYGVNAEAKASGFTPITTQTEGRSFMRFGGGESTDTATLTGDMTVEGINSYAFISQVEAGTMKLSSGTYFDESTDNKVIVSYDLATSNNLKVGDTITLQNIYTEASYPVEIIGVYDLTEDSGFGSNSNAVYMNVKTAAQFMSTTTYNSGDYSVQNVRYMLNSPENADAFIAEAKQKYPEMADNNLALSIDTSAYEQMVGPIESVGSFASTILWIVVTASVAIITLIVVINVKERRYEMGVLLSLGASKANVIGQVFAELLIVGTLAFAISVATSTVLAQSMGKQLLSSQVAASKSQEQTNFGRPGAAPSARGGGASVFFGRAGANNNTKAISDININVSPTDYLILFAIGYGIIIVSLLLPSWSIVKYQPKTILSGKE